jgi:ribosomal subunit interface protein
MKIFVQAKNMKVTQGIKNFVEEKAIRNVARMGEKVMSVKVYLENVARKKNDPQGAKAKVEIDMPGEKIVVEGKSFDPYQAITKAIKAGGRRLRKIKEKKELKKGKDKKRIKNNYDKIKT